MNGISYLCALKLTHEQNKIFGTRNNENSNPSIQKCRHWSLACATCSRPGQGGLPGAIRALLSRVNQIIPLRVVNKMISPNIWQFSGQSLMSWTAAYAIWEPISYKLFPAVFRAKTTQEYYNRRNFSFATVAAGDFLYSTMLLLVAQWAIGFLFGSGPVASIYDWIKRLLLFLGVQWIGDLSFYGIVKSLPDKWTPRYLDFFKRYGADVGIGAPIGDSIYGIIWLTLTQLVATFMSSWVQVFLITTFLFLTLIVSY